MSVNVAAAQPRPGSALALYEWNAWKRFLAPAVFPGCRRIEAAWSDTASRVTGRLDPGIRAFLFQVNLSRTHRFPLERERLVEQLDERGIRVLNRGIEDIRKSRLHSLLEDIGLPSARAEREGSGDEMLIIKTDLNYGGRYERRLTEEERRLLGLGEEEIPLEDWNDYRVVPRQEIPDVCWEMPGLVLERWIRNPDHEFFRAYVAGDRVVLVQAFDERPIQKVLGGTGDVNFLTNRARLAALPASDRVPRALLATIHHFFSRVALDFGCIDVLHDDRGFFVVDLNTTPYGGKELPEEVLGHLRSGLDV